MNSNNKKEVDNSSLGILYGARIGFSGIKLLLMSTTGIAGISVGASLFGASLIGKAFVSIAMMVGIDGILSQIFSYLEREKPVKSAYYIAVFFSLLTCLTTWFSGNIIGNYSKDLIDGEQATKMIIRSEKGTEKNIAQLNLLIDKKKKSIASMKSEISKLETQRDTSVSQFISSIPSVDHQMRLKNGSYSAFYGKRKYRTLTANVDHMNSLKKSYDDQIHNYKMDIEREQFAIGKYQDNQAEIITGNTQSSITQLINNNNQSEIDQANDIALFIRVLDGVLFFMMWGTFLFIRDLIRDDKTLRTENTRIEILPWLIRRLHVLKDKALETETKFDDYAIKLILALANLTYIPILIFTGFANLLSSIALSFLESDEDDEEEEPPHSKSKPQGGRPDTQNIRDSHTRPIRETRTENTQGTYKARTKHVQNTYKARTENTSPSGGGGSKKANYKGRMYDRAGLSNLISSANQALRNAESSDNPNMEQITKLEEKIRMLKGLRDSLA